MTETYWQVGRRIVELEQGGEDRAEYGAALLKRLLADLTLLVTIPWRRNGDMFRQTVNDFLLRFRYQ